MLFLRDIFTEVLRHLRELKNKCVGRPQEELEVRTGVLSVTQVPPVSGVCSSLSVFSPSHSLPGVHVPGLKALFSAFLIHKIKNMVARTYCLPSYCIGTQKDVDLFFLISVSKSPGKNSD